VRKIKYCDQETTGYEHALLRIVSNKPNDIGIMRINLSNTDSISPEQHVWMTTRVANRVTICRRSWFGRDRARTAMESRTYDARSGKWDTGGGRDGSWKIIYYNEVIDWLVFNGTSTQKGPFVPIERLCIHGFMALYKYFIISIIN